MGGAKITIIKNAVILANAALKVMYLKTLKIVKYSLSG